MFYISDLANIAAPTKEDLLGYRIYAVFIVKRDGSIHVYIGSRTADSTDLGRPRLQHRSIECKKGLYAARLGFLAYRFKSYIASDILDPKTTSVHLRVLTSYKRTLENKELVY